MIGNQAGLIGSTICFGVKDRLLLAGLAARGPSFGSAGARIRKGILPGRCQSHKIISRRRFNPYLKTRINPGMEKG